MKMNKHLKRLIKRNYKDSHYLARSNAIGMSLAFAPFPGQTPLILGLWLLLRKTKWRFSLGISIAWSFISNIFTNLPLFYLYYLTGGIIRGQKSSLSYHDIKTTFINNVGMGINYLIDNFALNIVIGSLSYMLTFGVLGYLLGLVINKKKH